MKPNIHNNFTKNPTQTSPYPESNPAKIQTEEPENSKFKYPISTKTTSLSQYDHISIDIPRKSLTKHSEKPAHEILSTTSTKTSATLSNLSSPLVIDKIMLQIQPKIFIENLAYDLENLSIKCHKDFNPLYQASIFYITKIPSIKISSYVMRMKIHMNLDEPLLQKTFELIEKLTVNYSYIVNKSSIHKLFGCMCFLVGKMYDDFFQGEISQNSKIIGISPEKLVKMEQELYFKYLQCRLV